MSGPGHPGAPGGRGGLVSMGEVLRAYFVPNGSYLMELAEDGVGGPSVEALQAIGREIRTELRPDGIVVASPPWQPKSGLLVGPRARPESVNDHGLRPGAL